MLGQAISIIVGDYVAIWITKIAVDSRWIDEQTACDMSNQLSLDSINWSADDDLRGDERDRSIEELRVLQTQIQSINTALAEVED